MNCGFSKLRCAFENKVHTRFQIFVKKKFQIQLIIQYD